MAIFAASSRILTAAANLLHSPAVAPAAASFSRRRLTCVASRVAPDPPDLIEWVRVEGGFVHPSLRIAGDASRGLGVVSDAGIPSESDLIVLPSHLPLRLPEVGGGGAESVLLRLAGRVPEELWSMKLGLRLLQERAKTGSFWWPYIRNLPETFSVPIFFSGEEIKNLQYAPVVYQVNKRCGFLLELEKEVKHLLEDVALNDHPFGGQDVNASSLGWAMSAVSSRAFRLHGETLSDGKRTGIPMLLPLIDMCNHSFSPNARIVQEQDKSDPKMLIKVVAKTQIEQDTLIMLNYGCLSNDMFLLDYGFVEPGNQFDYVELKYDEALLDAASAAAGVSFPNSSCPVQWQQDILSKLNLIGAGAELKVTLGGPGLVDRRLLAALRVLLASNNEEVQHHDLDTLMSPAEQAPLGASIESAVLRTAVCILVLAFKSFPTTIMEDEAILKGGVSRSMELAVKYRIEKKMMMIQAMRGLQKIIKMIPDEKNAAHF